MVEDYWGGITVGESNGQHFSLKLMLKFWPKASVLPTISSFTYCIQPIIKITSFSFEMFPGLKDAATANICARPYSIIWTAIIPLLPRFFDKPVDVVHKMLDTNLLKILLFWLLEYHKNIPFLEVFLWVILFDF